MNSNELHLWKKELLGRIEYWWASLDQEVSYKLSQKKYWKIWRWGNPKQPAKLSIRHLNKQFSAPQTPLWLCNEFSWILREWVRHSTVYDFRLGDHSEMIMWLQIAELTQYIKCLKGEVRDTFEQFRELAEGIMREIDQHYSTSP